jgi:hypothetical protein
MNKKLVILPALALAAMLAVDPAFAAAKKRGPPYDKRVAGNQHTVHGYAIRSENAGNWETKHVVTLHAAGEPLDSNCAWVGTPPSDPPTLDGADVFIQKDSAGNYWLNMTTGDNGDTTYTGNNLFIRRQLTPGQPVGGDTVWLASEPADDWNVYVFFKDSDPKKGSKDSIDKWYHVEIFPANGKAKAACDSERPQNSIKAVATSAAPKAQPCQTGSGAGGEPNH